MKLLTFDKYNKLMAGNDVFQICEPLFKNFGLNFFRYNRIYPDGTRLHLTTNYEFTEWIYRSKCSVASSIHSYAQEGLQFIQQHLENLPKQDAKRCLKQVKGANHFGIEYLNGGCEIVKRDNPDYCETIEFCSPMNNPLNPEFFINNQDVLNHFILYFKDKAYSLIEIANKNRIIPPSYSKLYANSHESGKSSLHKARQEFFKETELKRLAINGQYGEVYLTKREVESLLHLLRGRTAKETAVLMGISHKSVESYIAQTKEKLGCYKRSQLIDKAIEINLINMSYLKWLIHNK